MCDASAVAIDHTRAEGTAGLQVNRDEKQKRYNESFTLSRSQEVQSQQTKGLGLNFV